MKKTKKEPKAPEKKPSKLKKKATIIGIFIIVIYMITPPLLTQFARSLVYEMPPQKADYIVVLSGGNGERIKKAAELYRNGYAKKLLFTGDTYLEVPVYELMANIALKHGVPKLAISGESKSTSTYDHPKNCIPILKAAGAKHVIIVTSKFHTKRSYETFLQPMESAHISFDIVGADDGINYMSWWKDHSMSEKILLEWGKRIWYKLYFL